MSQNRNAKRQKNTTTQQRCERRESYRLQSHTAGAVTPSTVMIRTKHDQWFVTFEIFGKGTATSACGRSQRPITGSASALR